MSFISRCASLTILVSLMVGLLTLIVAPGCEQNGSPADNGGSSDASSNAGSANSSGNSGGPVYRDPPEENPALTDLVWDVIVNEDEARAIELVEQGVPLHARNDRGVTLLHFAARATMPNLTRKLLEYGADVNITIDNGQQPIHWAARAGASDRPNSEETIDVLLEYGADINALSDGGTRPIDFAIQLNNESWQQFLISRGANP